MTGYKESSKHKILTREEEVVLGRAVVEGLEASKTLDKNKSLRAVEKRALRASVKEGLRAKEIFVEHNLRLAMDTAANGV